MSGPEMVLPPVDVHGEVDAHLFDERVPAPFLEDRARPLAGGRHRPGACERHLFDALEVVGPDRYDEDDELLPNPYKLVLTCVRCGTVVRRAGLLEPDDWRTRRVAPTPVRAGDLLAQQISGTRHLELWQVYRDGARIGLIQEGITRRGREYFTARLDDDGPTTAVEGPSVLAALRKLARLAAVPA